VSRLRPLAGRLGDAAVRPIAILAAIALLDQAIQSAFAVLVPNVRDAFHMSNTGIESIVAAAGAAALLCTVPIAWLADRRTRVPIVLVGATLSALFSVALGFAPGTVFLAVTLCGVSMGQAVIFPTHNSLLADYYPVGTRPGIFATHRGGTALGAIGGVLIGAGLATAFSWRVPFVVFAVPVLVVVLIGLTLREPRRGHHERQGLLDSSEPGAAALASTMGSSETAAIEEDDETAADDTPEPPPSFGESWRMVWKVGVLRRIFYALPFVAAAIIGFTSLASIQYQQTFGLDAQQRAYLVAPVQALVLVGLVIGGALATRLAARGYALVFRMLAGAAILASLFTVLFALAPNVPVAFFADAGIEASLAIVGPGVLASLSLAIPARARARASGFSIGAIFVLPGLLVLPLVTAVGDAVGFRYGMLVLVPVFIIGGLIVASAGSLIDADMRNVWVSMAARAEMLAARRRGRLPLLSVRALEVGYDGVSVLRGIDIEIAEGEIVALLGTNSAGKSTLLRAIGGITEADSGAVLFDGRDITHMPPDEIARLGVAQVPGGEGVFVNLTVEENLRAGAWLYRRRPREVERMLAATFEEFAVLDQRRRDRAGDLSGGQQQVLALAMSLLARPRLLLVDELSLGLAPLVVEQLLESVRRLRTQGTAVLLVEQSVNVAVGLADRAYVLDGGVVRFEGTTDELREQPEVLWSVYVARAAAGLSASRVTVAAERVAPAVVSDSSGNGGGSRRPALSLRGISVSFGGINALSDVSFDVGDGETVGVVGPNGAGKTTLFDVVSGFVRPRGGRVELRGRDVSGASAGARARKGLGRSFQDSRLFADLTVRDTLAVALERFVDVGDPLNAMLRLPPLQRTEAAVTARVEELMALFGLERYSERFVRELSTGTRRLVDLAAVVAHRPSVVLLDEPTSGIAQREVEAMAGLLQRVREELGAAFVVVEHDMTFIEEVSDRMVALDQGSVVADGAPAAVLTDPHVVASLLGGDPLALARSGPGTRDVAAAATPEEGRP
jgi:branched-chain amino acid transport system ATP-binding protein